LVYKGEIPGNKVRLTFDSNDPYSYPLGAGSSEKLAVQFNMTAGISDENQVNDHGKTFSNEPKSRGAKTKVLATKSPKKKTDLFDIPSDVLVKIFNSGTRLKVAEQVSSKWRQCIRSDPTFWRSACERIGLTAAMISKEIRSEPLVWRNLWANRSTRICQGCLSNEGVPYQLFHNIQLCWDCRLLAPYNAITKTEAIRHMSFNTKKVKKVIEENDIYLHSFTYDRPCLWHVHKRNKGTLYQFKQIIEIAEMAFGKEKALAKTISMRKKLGIHPMHRGFLEEL